MRRTILVPPPSARPVQGGRQIHLCVRAHQKGHPDRRLDLRGWQGGWLLEWEAAGTVRVRPFGRTDGAALMHEALAIAGSWVRDGFTVHVLAGGVEWFEIRSHFAAHLERVRLEVGRRVA